MDREVRPAWTALLVPLPIVVVVALGGYSGNVLPWMSSQFSIGWVVLLAMTMVAFAGAYAATEPGPPAAWREGRPPVLRRLGGARLFGLAAFFFCLYLLSVLAWYIDDPAHSKLAGELTWWAVPLSVCFWVLAASELASETERAGSGEPADPRRQWSWLVTLRTSATARRFAYAFLFTGTVAFAVAGSVPGVVWRREDGAPAWRGHGYATTVVYDYGVAVWAGIVLIAATVYLVHAFVARPLGLPTAVVRRSWYAVWASGAVVVLMACFGLAAHGVLAEPIIDLAVAGYGIVYAVMLVDASAATRHRRVKSSLIRRALAAIVVVGFAYGISVFVAPALGLFRTGLLAIAVASIVPLFPVLHRALYGIERHAAQPDPPVGDDRIGDNTLVAAVPTDPVEREALYQVLLGREPAVPPSRSTLVHWLNTLRALGSAPLPETKNVPTRHVLTFLLHTLDDGLKNTKTWVPPENLIVLLEVLFKGDLDDQRLELVELLRWSARVLDSGELDTIGSGHNPHAMEMLEAECVARDPRIPADPEAAKEWTRLRDRRREWLFGTAVWMGGTQPVETSAGQGKYNKRRGSLRSDLLVRACEGVLGWWIANLETALSSDGPNVDR